MPFNFGTKSNPTDVIETAAKNLNRAVGSAHLLDEAAKVTLGLGVISSVLALLAMFQSDAEHGSIALIAFVAIGFWTLVQYSVLRGLGSLVALAADRVWVEAESDDE